MEYTKKVIEFLNKLTDILVPVISVAILLGVIFGLDTPFVGEVYANVSEILNMLGEGALLALVSIVIILAYIKK
jgi:hypothetical protein